MRIGSLFSGAGGLDMAVEQVFGGHTIWHCENDAAASKVLAERCLGVPNLGDITAVDWKQVDPVDVFDAGWPCQPWSAAGARKGAEDARALWPEVARAVRALRPRIVVLENVPNIIVLGELARAVGDLAEIGYDAQWVSVRASQYGAPHRRERVFILAHPSGDGRAWLNGGACSSTARAGRQWHTARSDRRAPVSDTTRDRRHEGWPESARLIGGSNAALGGADVALLPTPRKSDGDGGGGANPLSRAERMDDVETRIIRLGGKWGKYAPAIARWESITRPAPSATEPNTKGNPRLNPAFSEWMMGWPAGWVTQVDGISRNDQLRIIGNGVVPQQAEAAIRWLLNIAEMAA